MKKGHLQTYVHVWEDYQGHSESPLNENSIHTNNDSYIFNGDVMRTGALCSNKVIHITKKDAIEAKQRNEKKRGVSLRVYQCEKCKCWHITSQPIKGNNRRELS